MSINESVRAHLCFIEKSEAYFVSSNLSAFVATLAINICAFNFSAYSVNITQNDASPLVGDFVTNRQIIDDFKN